MSKAKQVVLYGNDYTQRTRIAESAIVPGMVIERTATGTVQPQSTEKVRAPMVFAREYSIAGGGLDQNYAEDDAVLCLHAAPGMGINALVPSGAAAIVEGDGLELVGDGTFRKVTNGERVATANEAVDNSAGASRARLAIEIG